MLISSIPGSKVVRVAGRTIPTQPIPPEFPGTYPTGFYQAAVGEQLPNHATFGQEFRSALDKMLKTKAPAEYDEFMQTGTCCSRQHQWVVLRCAAGVAISCYCACDDGAGLQDAGWPAAISGFQHALQVPSTHLLPGACAPR
jgi:hypothetical protein